MPFLLFVFISLILMMSVTLSQQCPCENQQSGGANWGSWVGQGQCIGRCDAARMRRIRNCFVDVETERNRQVRQCVVTVKSDCGECGGAWTAWSNYGRCVAVCRLGVQRNSRICYKKNTPPGINIRSNECRGSNKATEQFKNTTCRRRSKNCRNQILSDPIQNIELSTRGNATAANSPPATRELDLGSKKHSTASYGDKAQTESFINLQQELDEKLKEEILLLKSNNLAQVSGGIDTVTLAAVLGSLTIICITVVAIAAAVVYIKKQDLKKSAMISPTQSNNSFVKSSTKSLPSDPSFHSLAYANALRPLPPAHVSNPLYDTSSSSDEKNYETFESETLPYHPRDSTATIYEIDPIYFSVDELKR